MCDYFYLNDYRVKTDRNTNNVISCRRYLGIGYNYIFLFKKEITYFFFKNITNFLIFTGDFFNN